MRGRLSARTPQPDRLSCGGFNVQVTWGRLLGLCALLWAAVYFVQRSRQSPRERSPPPVPAPGSSSQPARPQTAPHHKLSPVPEGTIPSWCSNHGKGESAADLVGHLARIQIYCPPSGVFNCVWRDQTNAQVPFRMCNAPENEDNQVSRHPPLLGHRFTPALQISKTILESGQWHPSTKEALQAALPTASQSEVTHGVARERLVFLDVGASTGFFSLLAATRGYDVVAVEPVLGQAARIVESARALGLGVVEDPIESRSDTSAAEASLRKAADRWKAARKAAQLAEAAQVTSRSRAITLGVQPEQALIERKGSMTVLTNAWSDRKSPVEVKGYPQNPGASFVVEKLDWFEAPSMGSDPDEVVDLPGATDTWSYPGDALAKLGFFDPTEVAAIKISAEGMDSKVLNGLREVVSKGRPPLIVFVLNQAHVLDHGCDPRNLLFRFVDWGYRIYDYGLYRTDRKQIDRMIEGWKTASVTVVLIERSHRI
jgi:hypothetical protein